MDRLSHNEQRDDPKNNPKDSMYGDQRDDGHTAPPGPPGPHLTPEELDDLAAQASAERDPDQQEEAGGREAHLQDHLRQCPACRSALGDQVEVGAWLRRAPAVGPMPADAVARLDAALAGASSARANASAPAAVTAESAANLEHPGTVLPMTPRDERTGLLGRLAESRLTKSLVAAAAVLLIAGGTFAAIHRNHSTGDTNSGASSASVDAGASAPAAPGGAVQVRQTGTAYTTANISAEVTKQLAQTGGVVPVATPQAATDAKSTLLTPTGLKACLAALQAPGVVPVFVDIATYNGKPAAVLVLPNGDGTRDLWVVAPTCAPNADGTMLFKKLG